MARPGRYKARHPAGLRFLTPAKDLKSIGSTPLKCYVAPVSPLTFPALPTKSKRGTSDHPTTNASIRLEMQHSPTPTAHESHTMTPQTSPAPTNARSIPAPPEPGQVVQVRGAVWAVTNVAVQGLPRSSADDGEPRLEHVVDLSA